MIPEPLEGSTSQDRADLSRQGGDPLPEDFRLLSEAEELISEPIFSRDPERVVCPNCGVSTYYFGGDPRGEEGRPDKCIHCQQSFHWETCQCGRELPRKLLSPVRCCSCDHVVRPYQELVVAGEFPRSWSGLGLDRSRRRRDLPARAPRS